MSNQRTDFRRVLYTGAAIASLLASPALAENGDSEAVTAAAISNQAISSPTIIEETNRYALRLMTQIYDGVEDFSHTQLLGFGRIRKGNRSITQFDFGDGTVVIDGETGLAASRFMNVSSTEKAVVYNYDTKTISGESEIASFHNRYVRPWLGRGPALDRNAEWTTEVPLSGFGVLGLTDTEVKIALSREYFDHNGQQMVLIHYVIPAFSYRATGKKIVQWGRGISLTDPSFSNIYLNSMLHRAVVRENGSAGRPLRYARTMVAANPDGSAMIDYRDVPQLQQYVDEFFSPEAMRVTPIGGEARPSDRRSLALAKNMDLLALSIGEDGANDVPITAGAQGSGDRGTEVSTSLGARAFTDPSSPAFTRPQSNDLAAEEVVDIRSGGSSDALSNTFQGNGNGGTNETTGLGARDFTNPSSPVFTRPQDSDLVAEEVVDTRSGSSSGDFAVSPETLRSLDESRNDGGDPIRDALNRVQGGGSDLTFGNPEPQNSKDKPASTLDTVEATGNVLNTGLGYADKTNAISGGLLATETVRLANLAKDLGGKINTAAESYRQASARLKQSGKVTLKLMPQAQIILDRYVNTTNELGLLEKQLDAFSSNLANVAKQGGTITPENMVDANNLVSKYNDLHETAESQFKTFQGMDNKYIATFDDTDSFTARLLQNVEDRSRDLYDLEKTAANLENEATALQKLVRRVPTEQLQEVLDKFGDSPAGKVLDGVSHGMNAYTVGKSTYNTIDAAYNDKSSGQLDLARDHSFSGLALDLAALAGNAVSGNVSGFLSDAAAITFGSVSDIFLSGKALKDTHQLNARLLEQTRDMDRALMVKRHKKVVSLGEELAEAGVELASLKQEVDDSVKRSQDLLDERRRNREELRRQEEEDRRRAEVAKQERETENERRRTANDRFKESMDPEYPTAPPRVVRVNDTEGDEEYDGPPPTILTDQQLAVIEREKRRQEAQEDLDAYQKQKLADMKAEEAERAKNPGTNEFRTTALETSELIVSKFDMEPVEFERVEFDPVRFDKDGDLFDEDGNLRKVGPDDFKMTPFDPPDISKFPPTDPDDLDGYPGTGEYPSASLDSISGSATEPDLDQWADWLATQDVRKLEQLARGAGYPSLAFALANAERIIRQSLDSGYRAYANRGPNCAGYTGCTGSVGPWRLAYATIRLGDILAQSRGIFSSGGFSDIGISGFNLMYALRDFGIQDGDLIDVEITQFGRKVFTLRNHFLLTAGTNFSTNLRPGVSQMVVTALNEGSASPNTAAVTINNVVRGNGAQTYSLETGQTATLRIESGATE